jgi:hypothetical protein
MRKFWIPLAAVFLSVASAEDGYQSIPHGDIGEDYERVRAGMGWSTPPTETPETPSEYPEEENRFESPSGRVVHDMVFFDNQGRRVHAYAAGANGQLTFVEMCIEFNGSEDCVPRLADIEKRTQHLKATFVDPLKAPTYYWEFRELAIREGYVPDIQVRVGADGRRFMELSLYPDLDVYPCSSRCSVTWKDRNGRRPKLRVDISGGGPNLSFYRITNVRGAR